MVITRPTWWLLMAWRLINARHPQPSWWCWPVGECQDRHNVLSYLHWGISIPEYQDGVFNFPFNPDSGKPNPNYSLRYKKILLNYCCLTYLLSNWANRGCNNLVHELILAIIGLTPVVLKPGYSEIIRSITWLQVTCLIVSPGNQ